MSMSQDLRRGLIACVLIGSALSSVALTLGRSRGVALIGRPLDLAVAVTLDNAAQASDLCAEADVFQGDTRVDASRVTARVEPAGGANAVVRVRSSMPVDEPVVTVYLRLGCNQKVTRRYVLLSEEPGDYVPPAAPAVPALAPTLPAAPATLSRRGTAPSSSDALATTRPSGEGSTRPSRRAVEAAPMAPRGAAVGRSERALGSAQARAEAQPEGQGQVRSRSRSEDRSASRGGRSRLTVDMLDLIPERDPQLRSTSGMTSTPTTNEQVRAQAAALWRSINAQPQDVLHDIQRVQALESDVKGLRTLVSGNDRTLGELRGQLDQARQERTLTLAAIALLTLLLAAVVVTWWLRRNERGGATDWWGRREPAAVSASAAVAAPAGTVRPVATAGRSAEMDLRVDESMFESLQQAPRVTPDAGKMATPAVVMPVPAIARAPAAAAAVPMPMYQPGFNASQVASMRMVKAEELVDIQQQADFFMSLGQTEQAIEVLESHIHNNAETSALVWLDLLAIYRALKRREDYELLRADFQRTFNAEVPGYDATPTVSGGLEDYPRALSRIAALWPSPKVMDVIEESIFRKPGHAEGEPFDLEAYRELVMLYNLGREVVHVDDVVQDWSQTDSPKSAFFETSMQPLSHSRNTRPPMTQDDDDDEVPDSDAGQLRDIGRLVEQPFDVDSMLDDDRGPGTRIDEFLDPQVPRPSPRLGLDIDLSAPAEPVRGASAGGNSIDFEVSEPDDALRAGKARKL